VTEQKPIWPVDIFLARFPGPSGIEYRESVDYCMRLQAAAYKDPRVGIFQFDSEPHLQIDVARNAAVEKAKTAGADLLIMIDNDMQPDHVAPHIASKRQFFPDLLDLLETKWTRDSLNPMIVGVPYRTGAPFYLPLGYYLQPGNDEYGDPVHDLAEIPEDSAMIMRGIQLAPAVAAGLLAITMDVFSFLHLPYFELKTNESRTKLRNTEDLTFCGDAFASGIKCYCNWDAWAVHWKRSPIGKFFIASTEGH
jgi:hypothetical protein